SVHGVVLRPGERPDHREAEVGADLAGDTDVVARDDLDVDGELCQSLERGGRVGLRVVGEAKEAPQLEIPLVGDAQRYGRPRAAGRHCDDAGPVREELVDEPAGSRGYVAAATEDRLGRPLRDQQPTVWSLG